MCHLSNRCTQSEGPSHATCLKYEIRTSGFSLPGLVLFWIAMRRLLLFNDLFAGRLHSMKIKRFGSGSADIAIALRTREIQLPAGGKTQRLFQVAITCQNLLAPFSTHYIESALWLFPFGMPIHPFSLQPGRPKSSVQQVFWLQKKLEQRCLTCRHRTVSVVFSCY